MIAYATHLVFANFVWAFPLRMDMCEHSGSIWFEIEWKKNINYTLWSSLIVIKIKTEMNQIRGQFNV